MKNVDEIWDSGEGAMGFHSNRSRMLKFAS